MLEPYPELQAVLLHLNCSQTNSDVGVATKVAFCATGAALQVSSCTTNPATSTSDLTAATAAAREALQHESGRSCSLHCKSTDYSLAYGITFSLDS